MMHLITSATPMSFKHDAPQNIIQKNERLKGGPTDWLYDISRKKKHCPHCFDTSISEARPHEIHL